MKTKFTITVSLIAFILLMLTQTSVGLAQDEVNVEMETAPTAASGQAEVAAGGDTTAPADVENVKAEPGDAEVSLNWDVATDDVGVIGYKVYYGTKSVSQEGEGYELPPVSVDDVVTTTIAELENGKTYYFAVTAVDAGGNESASYSTEVNATPQAGLRKSSVEDDGKNPEIKEAKAKASDEVLVTFSEAIVMPIENPEKAFIIKSKKDANMMLNVKRAELDPEDDIGAAVILLTDAQKPNEEYEVTAGIEIEDHFGNAMVKDKNDKIAFVGFGTAAAVPANTTPQDTTPPDVAKAESTESNKIEVTFTESVILGDDPKSKFAIQSKTAARPLKILNVSLDKDGKIAYITTDPQENTEYEIKVLGVEDAAANQLAESTRNFQGHASSLRDLLPPEDVTQLVARLKRPEKDIIELTWKKSKNSAGDLANQMLYQSLDRGKNYDTGISLSPDTEKADVKNLKPGRLYTFKVTSKDTSGNESKGTIVSIRLPETGPALPLALGISLLAGALCRKKMVRLRTK